MMVLGRYIDSKAWHVVITRSGDVVRHNRFTKLEAADEFAARHDGSAAQVVEIADEIARRIRRGWLG